MTGWQEEVFFEDSMTPEKQRKYLKNRRGKLPSLWQWLYLTGKMLWEPGLDPQKRKGSKGVFRFTDSYFGAVEFRERRRKALFY